MELGNSWANRVFFFLYFVFLYFVFCSISNWMDGMALGIRIRDCMIEPASEFDIHRVYIHIGKAARFYFIFVAREVVYRR